MTPRPYNYESPECDFEHGLPSGREYFRLRELAALWECHPVHIQRLIDTGDLPVAVDIRGTGTSKSMQRIPRASVVAFLRARKSGAPTPTRSAIPSPQPTESATGGKTK